VINDNFLTTTDPGTWRPFRIAVDLKGNFYVTGNDRVEEFASDGTLLNLDLIDLAGAYGIAIDSQDNLFLGAYNGSSVAQYSTNGTLINSSFITGVSNVTGIVVGGVNPVPEPSIYILFGLGFLGLVVIVRRKDRSLRGD
jgi:sugar lactone lactonase YvrE